MLAFRRSQGFTLIELLIVMALVGLAVSLVGPSLYSQYQSSNARQERQKFQMLSQYAAKLAFYNRSSLAMDLDGKRVSIRALDGFVKEQEKAAAETEMVGSAVTPLHSESFNSLFFKPQTIEIDGNGNYLTPLVKVRQSEKEYDIALQSISPKTTGNDAD